MGGCVSSDVEGGQQAVGGGAQPYNPTTTMNTVVVDHGTASDDAVDYFYKSHGLLPVFTQLELSLSASKLRDRDILSKSDPMAVGYVKKINGALEEIGRTEVIMNTLNPVWIGKFYIAYHFEIVQPLVFHVYDIDTKYHNLPVKMLKLKEQEFLGEASCVLSEIVTKRSKTLTLGLQRKDSRGVVIDVGSLNIHAEESISSRKAFEMIFHCTHLESKDHFSKSDPFLRISKISEAGNVIPVCKAEVVQNNSNPSWKPVCLTMQQIGGKGSPLVIECFDFDSSGSHGFIGKLQKSVSDLEILSEERVRANFEKPSSALHGHMKTLILDGFWEKLLYSFLDYISSGFELNFIVAVDFTASNGNPQLPDSLHYIDPSGRLNAYQQVLIQTVKTIVALSRRGCSTLQAMVMPILP